MNKVPFTLVVSFFATLFFVVGWFGHDLYSEYKLAMQMKHHHFRLDTIRSRGFLNVVLLNAPSTYYIGPERPQGFEYDLLNAYAKHLHVDLNITAVHTVKEALEWSQRKDVDITSAALAKTPMRQKKYHFGPSYFEVQEQVICSRAMLGSKKFPRDIEDLSGLRIMVGEETSYSETLKALQEDGFDINVSITDKYSTEELLDMVARREIDCTLADSNIYAFNLKYSPDIVLAFSISSREQLAWVLPKNAKMLEQDMYTWLNHFNQKGKITQLKDHYYSYVLFFDYYNTKVFYRRIKTRLEKYKKYFQEAAKEYHIPWTLLASVSYQESHWNPKAKSYTGVRGLMMLTRDTAKLIGVKNRLDPKESIFGGAKHLKQMIRYIPKEVDGEDKLKFALAAYNVGLGHIYDAMHLAQKMGLRKNMWSDLKKVLPLLSQKRYYQKLKYGYARGSEPVKYVEAIYNYRDILLKTLEDSSNKKEDSNTTSILFTP